MGRTAPWAEAVPTAGGSVGDRAAAKAHDLARLYRAYCRELESRGLLDGAALFEAAALAVPGCRSLGKTIVYGIYDLNEVQQKLIVALLAAGADVLEPLPREAARLNDATLGAARAAGLAEQRFAGPRGAHRPRPDRRGLARRRGGDRRAALGLGRRPDASPSLP